MKTTKITVETERTLVIRRAEQFVDWCPCCNSQREYILLDDTALMELALAVQIQLWRETGSLHISQQQGTRLFRICLASLLCFELDRNSELRIAKEAL